MAELSVILKGKLDDLKRTLNEAENLLESTGETADETNKKISDSGKKSAAGTREGTEALKGFGKELLNNSGSASSMADSVGDVISSIAGSGGLTVVATAAVAVLGFLVDQYLDAVKAQAEFNRGLTKGVEQAQSQIVSLETLLSIARDVTASDQARAKAIARINDEYGDYLPNINQENINTKSVTESINTYNQALLRQAKIKAAQNLITEEFAKILELEAKGAIGNANALDFLTASFLSYGNAATFSSNLTVQGFQRQQKEISESEARIESLRNLLANLLTDDFNFGGLGDLGGSDEQARTVQVPVEVVITPQGLQPIENAKAQISEALNIAPIIRERNPEIFAALLELNEGASQIIQDNIFSTFAGIGQAIGQALAEGENIGEALAKSLLSSIGNVLIQLGELAIATGVGLIGIKTALKTLNPVAAIAAGVALVALGSAVSSGAGKIGGQIGSGGSGSISGQGSTSTFSGGRASSVSSSTGGEVVFRLRGRELIGVIENERAASARLGG